MQQQQMFVAEKMFPGQDETKVEVYGDAKHMFDDLSARFGQPSVATREKVVGVLENGESIGSHGMLIKFEDTADGTHTSFVVYAANVRRK